MTDELDIDALLDGIDQRPREHHYVFAHIALPMLAFALDPRVELANLALALEDIRGLWDEVGRKVGEPLDGTRFAVEFVDEEPLSALVVTLPPVAAAAEAIMVAIVRRPVRRLLVLSGFELRYFTLEHGFHLTAEGGVGESRTVLCEWNRKQRHSNYGDGPPAEPEAFAKAAFAVCRR